MSKKSVTIGLHLDDSCEMAKITVAGDTIFEGNEWDFHPGCQGPVDLSDDTEYSVKKVIRSFHGSDDLFEKVVTAYEKAGFNVAEERLEYSYE